MTDLTFKRTSPDEARIYQGNEYVGDVYRMRDILSPGKTYFEIHLEDDPRGPARIHDRSRIREVAERLVHTHPYG